MIDYLITFVVQKKIQMDNFIIEEFENYKVFLYSRRDSKVECKIFIKIPSCNIFLWFVNGELKDNDFVQIGNRTALNCYFRADRYPHFIDLLRNEGPLFFYYNKDNHTCYITTSDEPVGEGEHQHD